MDFSLDSENPEQRGTVAVTHSVLQQLTYQHRSSLVSSAILGIILVFGLFNRITFPTFTVLPLLWLLPHFLKRYDLPRTPSGSSNKTSLDRFLSSLSSSHLP